MHSIDSNSVSPNSLWLSPQQEQLTGIMQGFERIDAVWNQVQHVAYTSSAELNIIKKKYHVIKEKHVHLAEWSEKEAIRKSGLKSFGSQFNYSLRDPTNVDAQTEVTWLARVPVMNPTASLSTTMEEKIMMVVNNNWEAAQHELALRKEKQKQQQHHLKAERDNSFQTEKPSFGTGQGGMFAGEDSHSLKKLPRFESFGDGSPDKQSHPFNDIPTPTPQQARPPHNNRALSPKGPSMRARQTQGGGRGLGSNSNRMQTMLNKAGQASQANQQFQQGRGGKNIPHEAPGST